MKMDIAGKNFLNFEFGLKLKRSITIRILKAFYLAMAKINHNITQILQRWSDGDENAVEQLIPFVYDELRKLARNYLARERRRNSFTRHIYV